LADRLRRQAERFGPPAPPAKDGARDAAVAGHHAPPDPRYAATVAQPPKIDNDPVPARLCEVHPVLQVRGGVRHRSSETRARSRWRVGGSTPHRDRVRGAAPDSACGLLRQLQSRCAHGGADVQVGVRSSTSGGTWDEARQTVTRTVCPYCGVGCNLDLHVQDNENRQVSSPLDHDVTSGNLCIKGRFAGATCRTEAAPRLGQTTPECAAGACRPHPSAARESHQRQSRLLRHPHRQARPVPRSRPGAAPRTRWPSGPSRSSRGS